MQRASLCTRKQTSLAQNQAREWRKTMAENQYIYAVARIRSKEMSLLSHKTMEQLIACKNYEDCLRILSDKGWDCEGKQPEEFLTKEREKTWALMKELVEDMSVFDVFLYENDFHNLKAAIKQVCNSEEVPNIYKSNGTMDPKIIYEAVKHNDFKSLPEYMQECGQRAYEVALKSRDSQLCDVILDKASLEMTLKAGIRSKKEIFLGYARLKVVAADINIAIRSCKTNKSAEFLKQALAACDTLDIDALREAVLHGVDAIYEYLETTVYADAIEAIKTSPSAFEKWCDDKMIEYIKPQKYNPFTIEPLAAYVLARENEIKCVRILLSGKLNDLSEESIQERLREMYV